MTSYRYTDEMIEFVLERTVPTEPIPRGKKRALYEETAELFGQKFPNFESPVKYAQIKYITDHFGSSTEFGNPKGRIIYHDPTNDRISKVMNNSSEPTRTATQNGKSKCILCPHCSGKGFLEVSKEPAGPSDASPANLPTPVTPYPNPAAIPMGTKLYQGSESATGIHGTPIATPTALPTPITHRRPLQFGPLLQQQSPHPVTTPSVPLRAGIREGVQQSTGMRNIPASSAPKGIWSTINTGQEAAMSPKTRPGAADGIRTNDNGATTLGNRNAALNTAARNFQNQIMLQRKSLGMTQQHTSAGQNISTAMNMGTLSRPVRGQVSQMTTPNRYQPVSRASREEFIPQTTRLVSRQPVPTAGRVMLMPSMGQNSASRASEAATHGTPLKRPRPNDEASVGIPAGNMGHTGAQEYKPMANEPASKRRKTDTKENFTLANGNGNLSAPVESVPELEPSWDSYLDDITSNFFSDEVGLSYDQNHAPMDSFTLDLGVDAGNDSQVNQNLTHQDAGLVTSTTADQSKFDLKAPQAPQAPQAPKDSEEIDMIQDFLDNHGSDLDYQITGNEMFGEDSATAGGAEFEYPDIFGC
ncbi:hypothetical protein F4813DRAFT_396134 [Daldinia decipiens]|uniref:uncharacterized protein n=1 Tax=Daldinia decipiens TaxID=326647 RepID=UPI0020C584B5|nr:uncharacterized protein F4813DRAFT_396134 [Daldinia decipiens]KAI1657597.1 hypothetical protein F4813DRAFT_396134 [Daldinia decipiens]